jgi:hypothetical protein
MTLADLQRRMAEAIMAPLAASAPRARPEVDELIKPNGRLTAVERLEIYRRSYWFRLLDSFREDFPGLAAVLGPRTFNRLAEAYLTELPSRSFTLRNLGSRLEQWLRRHSEFAGKDPALALDMVRLEWAHIEAYDGGERKPLGPEDLLELGPEMKFALQPHIALLELSYPVDDLRIRVQALAAQRGAASNMVARRRERAAVKRYGAVDPVPTFLAVHRVEFTVYYKRLELGEFRVLAALSRGVALGEALDAAAQEAGSVEGWFATWARLGWLCSPEGQPT